MPNSRLKEAFVQGPNLVGLAAVAALSMAQLDPLPLIVGAVAEVAYLLFAPDSAWIRGKVDRQRRAAEEQAMQARRAATMDGLRPDLHDRFDRLSQKRADVVAAVAGNADWSNADLPRSLDKLLDSFLEFAGKEGQYRQYLQSVRDEVRQIRPAKQSGKQTAQQFGGPIDAQSDTTAAWANQVVAEVSGRYMAECDRIKADADAEQDPDAKSLLLKREQVLRERDEYVRRSGKALVNIHRQLTLLEDAFGLINDQIRARPPDQVKADLDGVLATTQTMSESLDEMAQFEHTLTTGGQP